MGSRWRRSGPSASIRRRDAGAGQPEKRGKLIGAPPVAIAAFGPAHWRKFSFFWLVPSPSAIAQSP
jgi:hypothetical protein